MANEVILTASKKSKRTKPKSRTITDEEGELLTMEGAGKDQTRAKFNEMLQDAYLESTKTDGKKKKRPKGEKSALLESLKKGDGIRKDSDNTLLLANTYDPDDDPKNNKKSNKRRQREMEKPRNGVENQAYTEENELQVHKPRTKSAKKANVDKEDKPMTIEELAPPKKKKDPSEKPVTAKTASKTSSTKPENRGTPAPKNVPASPKPKRATSAGPKDVAASPKPKRASSAGPKNVPASPKAKRSTSPGPKDVPASPAVEKRRRRKKPASEELDKAMSDGADTGTEDADPSGSRDLTSDPEQGLAKVKKKKKKKQPVKAEEPEEEPPRVIEDHGRIVGLTIHRTDKLKTDFLILHPLVRITVIDESTGNYLTKQTSSRAVTSYYETENENVNFVLPIMSQPYDFKQNKSTLPIWEELLILNENFDYFIQEDPKVILFFEILDFMSMNAANHKRNVPSKDGGWHRIAWAFCKVLGSNGKPNTDKKVRLQLYKPPVRFNPKPGQIEIFQWWKHYQKYPAEKIPYPSTLYVTVKGIIPPETVEPAPRSMFATQQERGTLSYDEMQRRIDGGTSKRDGVTRGPSLWTRLAGQLCKVPNNLFLGLPAGKKGCFVVKFSYDGKYLACGCHDKDGYPILIYEIPSGKLRGQLNGHYGIIYDMSWSRNHSQLLTASGDGTARVWSVEKMSNTALKTLPHPSFVYAAKFHIRVDKVVVTGGYDRMIRVWTLSGDETHAQLIQELDGHMSYVNSLCFDTEGQTMYSADSVGCIRVWNIFTTDKPSSNGILREWTFNKEIVDPEFKGVAINCLQLHPSGRRLLVHTRDNILRLFDLRIGAIMQRYRGALNFREQVRSTMSSCGSFVFTGSEDSCAYVWNADTGDQVASYKELGYRHPVCDVDFHPHEHMVAFCSFGENHQILVYKYDHRVAQHEVGIDPVETVKIPRKTGRPMSPEVKAGVADIYKSDDEILDTVRTMTGGPMDKSLQHSARMERARRKLDSVMAFQGGSMRPTTPMGMTRDGSPPPTGTWGSTFDTAGLYTTQGRSKSPAPSMFSPHASRTMSSAVANQQQLTAQTEYMKQGHGGWRPGFTDVGRGSGPTPYTRAPITLSTSQGKPQLQIHGNRNTSHWVVALYDYQKQRSDELVFSRGDVLRVICKDTENWWLAQNAVGEEGYIPANYVTTQGEDEDLLEYKIAIEKDDDDSDTDDLRKSHTAAVIAKSGELKFISGTEDSDAESTTVRRKRTQKPRSSKDTVINVDSDCDSVTKVHRRRPRSKLTEARMRSGESNA